jgi:biotin operon repressor
MNKLEPFRSCNEISPATAKLLYLVLREISNDHDTIILPQRRLAETLGISRGAVSRNLRRLEHTGLLDIQSVYNVYGGRMPNKITLNGSKKDG